MNTTLFRVGEKVPPTYSLSPLPVGEFFQNLEMSGQGHSKFKCFLYEYRIHTNCAISLYASVYSFIILLWVILGLWVANQTLEVLERIGLRWRLSFVVKSRSKSLSCCRHFACYYPSSSVHTDMPVLVLDLRASMDNDCRLFPFSYHLSISIYANYALCWSVLYSNQDTCILYSVKLK